MTIRLVLPTALALSLAASAPSARHFGTVSSVEITLLEHGLVLVVRADALIFADYVRFRNAQGPSVSPEALLAGSPEVGTLVRDQTALTLNGQPAALVVESVDVVPRTDEAPAQFRVQLSARAESQIESATLDYGLFRGHDPAHRGYARIRTGADVTSWVFARGVLWRWIRWPPDSMLPAWRGPLQWLREGIDHILTGPDHLLFLFGLVVVARNARRVAATVTGFTLAHSTSLACATLGLVRVPLPPIEAAIALSIAWVGVTNWRTPERESRIAPALTFGLVHGLGFSEVFQRSSLAGRELIAPLSLFTVGIELGQVMLLLLVLPILFTVRDRWPRLHSFVFLRSGAVALVVGGLILIALRLPPLFA